MEAGHAGDWTACMRAENFAGAWDIADCVLARRARGERNDPDLPYHLRWVWDGTPPDGRDVLVRCYHGLGDTLQFARFLPALRARASCVTLELQPALCRLLRHLPGVDRLVPFDEAAPLPQSSCDVEIMELGHMLRAQAPDIAACASYLTPVVLADTSARGAIGLCWQAGGWDVSRSISLSSLLATGVATGRRLVSLQRGPACAEAHDARFINPRDDSTDIARTASLIAACSGVVTVDTMVAHLAGALGRAVVVLLKADADWRWPESGSRSAWYPTARLLRQHRDGDWSGPLAELAQRQNLLF